MTDQVRVRVGQLWRRRRDGKAFIPAHHVGNSWFNKAGVRRTVAELRDSYVLVPVDDDATGEASNGR
jgi:hypothetical protein